MRFRLDRLKPFSSVFVYLSGEAPEDELQDDSSMFAFGWVCALTQVFVHVNSNEYLNLHLSS